MKTDILKLMKLPTRNCGKTEMVTSIMKQIKEAKTKALLDKGIPEVYHCLWDITNVDMDGLKLGTEVRLTLEMNEMGIQFFQGIYLSADALYNKPEFKKLIEKLKDNNNE